MKKKILSMLVLLMTAATGAWALPAYLYLVVDGTSATVMYGDKGENPYYGPDAYDSYGWLVAGASYSCESLTTVTIDASCQNYTGTTLEYFFENWTGLTTINNLENLNMSEVTNMQSMFGACSSMTSFDFISGWNTAKVTNMGYMFFGVSVETLDLSSFNTSSVTSMSSMFSFSQNLKNIYVGDGWSTASVTDGSSMFAFCESLPGFDSGKVTHEMAKLTTDGGYLQVKPAGPEVTWDAATKTGTFAMPGYDVELEVAYFNITAPTANTTDGDIHAGTATPLINAASTTEEGATIKYLVTATNEQPTSTDGFSADVPTAEAITAPGTYYVWYYLDFATGDDSDISAQAIEVTVADYLNYTVIMANGTEDSGKWTITPPDATDPEKGVKPGTEIKATYSGTKRVKSVKAVKKAPVAEGHALSASAVGEIVCSDGLAYAAADKDNLPQGVTAVAKICYVSGSNGLALALADETGTMNWSTAITTCAAHTPAITGGTWKLATEDEWNNMITAAGSATALRDGFTSVGGSNLQSEDYWSSTEKEDNSGNAAIYPFNWSAYNFDAWNECTKVGDCYVRACLAW